MSSSSKSSTKPHKHTKTSKKKDPDVNQPGILGYHYLTNACTMGIDDYEKGPRITQPDVPRAVEYQQRKFFHSYNRIRMKTQLLRASVAKPSQSERARVEFAARLYSGAHAEMDRPRALQLWKSVASQPVPAGSTIFSGPSKILARHVAEANVFLCMVYLRTFEDTFSWSDLAAAFQHGEAGARLGLFTAAGHTCVRRIRKFVIRQTHIAMRFPGPPPEAPDMPHVMNAQDASCVESILMCEKLVQGWSDNYWDEDEEDESDDEDTLPCGRPGCDIVTTTPSDFKRCGGKCPMHIKPYYCSKECQKKDWKRHKPQCERPSGSAEEKHIQYTDLHGKQVDLDLTGMKNSKVDVARHIAESFTFMREDKRVPGSFAAFMDEMMVAVNGSKGQTPDQFVRMVDKWPKGWVLPHN